MGLTIERMENKDALFFKQLLTPICNPLRSTIANNPQKPYYHLVAKYTSMKMASEVGLYLDTYRTWSLQEIVNCDGIVVHNTNKNIHNSWLKDGPEEFNERIHKTMYYQRFVEYKRFKKLSDHTAEKGQ